MKKTDGGEFSWTHSHLAGKQFPHKVRWHDIYDVIKETMEMVSNFNMPFVSEICPCEAIHKSRHESLKLCGSAWFVIWILYFTLSIVRGTFDILNLFFVIHHKDLRCWFWCNEYSVLLFLYNFIAVLHGHIIRRIFDFKQ